MAAIGILTAPLGRAQTGLGPLVDVSMTEGAMALLPTFPRISEVEQEQRYTPPQLGEHTASILQEAGYDAADVERFKTNGVI